MKKKKILIAGAGHGGLVAAKRLAENGYDVTVYERKTQKQLGYDWKDMIHRDVLKKAGISLSDSEVKKTPRMAYYIASASFPVKEAQQDVENNSDMVERKLLLSKLVTQARQAGAKVRFGVEILAAITENDRVVGITTSKGDYRGDLVIDSAGVNSPVKASLPPELGIKTGCDPGEVLYAYRGIYEKNDDYPEGDCPYEIFIYLHGIRGLCWCITEGDCVDILVGSFGSIRQEYIDSQLESFRIRRKQLGKKLLRGGEVNVIPTRRPLSRFVADGYAAIGDCAFMTHPMSGSGIDNAVTAGVLLAEAVLADENGEYTAETLWSYNHAYISRYAGAEASMDVLKNTMLMFLPESLDALFENNVITGQDLMGGGSGVTKSEVMAKIGKGLTHLPTLLKIGAALSKGDAAKKIYAAIPQAFDQAAVEAWEKQVQSTFVTLIPNSEMGNV